MTQRSNILGTPVSGDPVDLAVLRHVEEGELKHFFEVAREQGSVDFDARGVTYRLLRNSDYTMQIRRRLPTEGDSLFT